MTERIDHQIAAVMSQEAHAAQQAVDLFSTLPSTHTRLYAEGLRTEVSADTCAFPTRERALSRGRIAVALTIDTVVRAVSMVAKSTPLAPDVLGLVADARARQEEAHVPVGACVIMHEALLE